MKVVPWLLCSAALVVPSFALADDAPKETPEQAAFRGAYVAKTVKRIHEIVDSGNKVRTPDETTQINLHWGRAMKAIRIREVAQDNNDNAFVGQVDGFLSKLDTQFYDRLLGLASNAPDKPKAPELTAPTGGSSFRLNQTFSCKFANYAGATAHTCGVRQGGHAVWYACGTSGECHINLSSWTFMTTGPAQVVGRAQVDHKFWSDEASVAINLTPSDAPAAPNLEAPVLAAVLTIDKSTPFKFADYPNASKYFCVVRQGSAFVEGTSTTHDCALEVHSRTPTPFHNGFANVSGYVKVNDKWSQHVSREVDLVGEAPLPAAKLDEPTNGQQVAPDQPLTCKFTEYPGASMFRCYLPYGGGCTATAGSRNCSFVVKTHHKDKPIDAGTHSVYVQAYAGRWSPSQTVNVTLTGNAAPISSGSAKPPTPPPPSPSGNKGGAK
jgi:hypothetical protein